MRFHEIHLLLIAHSFFITDYKNTKSDFIVLDRRLFWPHIINTERDSKVRITPFLPHAYNTNLATSIAIVLTKLTAS
jgi:hypothetical protein